MRVVLRLIYLGQWASILCLANSRLEDAIARVCYKVQDRLLVGWPAALSTQGSSLKLPPERYFKISVCNYRVFGYMW